MHRTATATATAPAVANLWVKIDRTFPKYVPEKIEVSKSRDEEVEWFSDDPLSYKIVFPNRSPFKSKEFHVPQGGTVCSGPPVNGVIGDVYKYEIRDANLNTLLVDPEIVIKG